MYAVPLLSLLVLAVFASAASAGEHPCAYVASHAIEANFARAVEHSGGVTVDLRDAQSTAYVAWNAELNRLYRTLLDGMPEAADRDALRKAQRAWLAFHEAESEWLNSDAMHGQEGTSGPLNIAGAGLTRLQQRVCDLKAAQELRALQAN